MTDSSAWPGMIQTGTSTVRPAVAQLDHVARSSSPSRSAGAGLTSAALSQVSLVSGLGSSWSQPLLAKRPSQIVGSGRKTSSRPSRLGRRRRAASRLGP